MGFKLGKNRGFEATSGEIKTKLRFGKKSGGESSVPGTPIIRVPLAKGIMGEANMDGSIYISDEIIPGSEEEKKVINHEMRHSTDMRLGKLEYGDDYIKHNGNTYHRKTIEGKDMINIDGKWKEAGSHDFPWEQEANNGNGNI